MAAADQAQCAAAQLKGVVQPVAHIKVAAPEHPVHIGKVPGAGHNHEHGVLRRRIYVADGGVHHLNAPLGGRFHVDAVQPDALLANGLQAGAGVHHRGAHPVGPGEDGRGLLPPNLFDPRAFAGAFGHNHFQPGSPQQFLARNVCVPQQKHLFAHTLSLRRLFNPERSFRRGASRPKRQKSRIHFPEFSRLLKTLVQKQTHCKIIIADCSKKHNRPA